MNTNQEPVKRSREPYFTIDEDHVIITSLRNLEGTIDERCEEISKILKNRSPKSIKTRYYNMRREDLVELIRFPRKITRRRGLSREERRVRINNPRYTKPAPESKWKRIIKILFGRD